MAKTKRTTVTFYEGDKARFDELKTLFSDKGTYQDVMRYLVSLENSLFERGTGRVERKLKQWLYLGYEGEITVHKLRTADYDRKGEHKEKTIALKTAKDVFEKYRSEIEQHNKKFLNNQ